MNGAFSAGRKGNDVRSDCFVSLTRSKFTSNEINIHSRVEAMYGNSIKEIAHNVLEELQVKNVRLDIEDSGALPFTLAARIETACLRGDLTTLQYLRPCKKHALYNTERDRLRRSRLYIPGNEPKYFINAGLHKPDEIILDLEDSVHPNEKDAARILVRNALREVDFYGSEVAVRVNQGSLGIKDLDYVLQGRINVILIPKVEEAEQVVAIDNYISDWIVKNRHKLWDNFQRPMLMPIIESAKGGINAFAIAKASSNIVSLAIGLEDYTADIGVKRTIEGKESFYFRSQVVNAAKAVGITAIDTVFSDVNDTEGLRLSSLESKSLGFEGRGCIHPRQIKVIHEAFIPTEDEVSKAKRIVEAFKLAGEQGTGVVSLGSKMIDAPVVKRAIKLLSQYEKNSIKSEF